MPRSVAMDHTAGLCAIGKLLYCLVTGHPPGIARRTRHRKLDGFGAELLDSRVRPRTQPAARRISRLLQLAAQTVTHPTRFFLE